MLIYKRIYIYVSSVVTNTNKKSQNNKISYFKIKLKLIDNVNRILNIIGNIHTSRNCTAHVFNIVTTLSNLKPRGK